MSKNIYVEKMTQDILERTKFVESNDPDYTHIAASSMLFKQSFIEESFVKTMSEDIYEIFKTVAEEVFVKAKITDKHVIPFLHRTFTHSIGSTASSIGEFIVNSKYTPITGLDSFVLGEKPSINCVLLTFMFGISTGSDPFLHYFVSLEKGTSEMKIDEFTDIYKTAEPFIKFEL